MTSSKTAVPPPHLTTLMYQLPVRRLKIILSHVVNDTSLMSVEELKTTQLARLYILTMSDERKLLLSLSPSLTLRLLRHEAMTLYSEAALVSFATASKGREDGAVSPPQTGPEQVAIPSELSELIPTLFKHSGNNSEVGYPYSIFEPTAGVPLSTISIYLSLPERRIIDTKIGTLARSLASLTSPSGRFGLVGRVLPEKLTTKSPSVSKPQGSKTWSEAFNNLLESVLRDGEDMAVVLPYDSVRAHFKRLSWRLDAVISPRLVLLNLGDEANIMVERTSETAVSMLSEKTVKVTGLRSWSQGVFGDPMIASCFDEPSEAFMQGWRGGRKDTAEDEAHTEGRKLLYRCYRAVVGIVTEYYRPQGDSSRKELEARRKLTGALAELEKFDCAPKELLKRSRARTNGTEEGSKRQKVETE